MTPSRLPTEIQDAIQRTKLNRFLPYKDSAFITAYLERKLVEILSTYARLVACSRNQLLREVILLGLKEHLKKYRRLSKIRRF